MTEEITHTRSIRSFVRRNRRMTTGQKKALDKYWPRYGIELADKKPDLDQLFRRKAPRILDIGCGMGDATVEIAKNNLQMDLIAVEVHQPGIGNTIRLANGQQLNNLRIIAADIVEVLQQKLFVNDFDKVLIYFPDPWPKKRHHKRRLINTRFLDLLLPCLKSHARLYIATDWQDYAEQIREVCDENPGLRNLAGTRQYAPRPAWRPKTKFESRGRNMGHDVWDFAYAFTYRA